MNGFFAGGFAKGVQSGAAIQSQRKRDGIAQQQADTNQQAVDDNFDLTQQKISSAERQKQLSLLQKNGEAIVKGAIESVQNGVPLDKVLKSIDLSFSGGGARGLGAVGVDPKAYAEALKSRISVAATPEQAGAAETQKLTGQLGQTPTRTQIERKAGVADPDIAPTNIAKLQAERQAALQRGDKQGAAEILARINKLGSVVGRTEFDAPAPTKKTISDAQKKVSQSADAVSGLASIRRSVSEGVLGLRGAIKGVLNVTAAQADPQYFDKNRANFENIVKSTRETLLKTISSDSRFSDRDRTAIENLFPSTGVFESEQNALSKLDALDAIIIKRLTANLQNGGGGLGFNPKDISKGGLLEGLNLKRLQELTASKHITPEEAGRVIIGMGLVK